jgi:hypothetical protein
MSEGIPECILRDRHVDAEFARWLREQAHTDPTGILAEAFAAGFASAEETVDQDMSGGEPASVIVVTENTGRERRFIADSFQRGTAGLTVQRGTKTVAHYPSGCYRAVRDDAYSAQATPDDEYRLTPAGMVRAGQPDEVLDHAENVQASRSDL